MIIKPNELIKKILDWDHKKSFEELLGYTGEQRTVTVNMGYRERHEATYSGVSILVDVGGEGTLSVFAMNEDGWEYVSDVSKNIVEEERVMDRPLAVAKALVVGNTIRALISMAANTNDDVLPLELVSLLAATEGNNIFNTATKELYLVEEVVIDIPMEIKDASEIDFTIIGKAIKPHVPAGESIELPINVDNAHLFTLHCHDQKYDLYCDSRWSKASLIFENTKTWAQVRRTDINLFVHDAELDQNYLMRCDLPDISLDAFSNVGTDYRLLVVPPSLNRAYVVAALPDDELNVLTGVTTPKTRLIAHDLDTSLEYQVNLEDLNCCYLSIVKGDSVFGPNNLVGKGIRAALIGDEVMHYTVGDLDETKEASAITRFCYPDLLTATKALNTLHQSEQAEEAKETHED